MFTWQYESVVNNIHLQRLMLKVSSSKMQKKKKKTPYHVPVNVLPLFTWQYESVVKNNLD